MPNRRAAVAKAFAGYHAEFSDVPIIAIKDAVGDDRVLFVDVREDAERAVSMLPGALDQATFEQKRDQYAERQIVVYCTIGYRSGAYAQTLREAGLQAYNLEGSILGWVHAGRPVLDPAGEETRLVHVYGAKWDLLPSGYGAVGVK